MWILGRHTHFVYSFSDELQPENARPTGMTLIGKPMADMVGILVHGNNHFIVRGPLPNRDIVLALVRHWSLIQIGATVPHQLDQWHIVSREFRENLEWAVVVPGDDEISPAVTKMLDELSARGIIVHESRLGPW
jgi:hypothetical protein